MEKKAAVKEVRVSLAQVRVGVVGTGNYGRALRSKLLSVGAEVVWGSRSPGPGTDQVSLETVMEERLVVLAVPVFSWASLPLDSLVEGTVVVDCSNRASWCREGEISQAEQLQDLLPSSVRLVKCLNTLSAYELENTSLSPGKQVRLTPPSSSLLPTLKSNLTLNPISSLLVRFPWLATVRRRSKQ